MRSNSTSPFRSVLRGLRAGRSSPVGGCAGLMGAALAALLASVAVAETVLPPGAGERTPPGVRGLPFNRVYQLAEIGHVSRGARLGFDAFGRIAVISDGAIVVLNDTAWLDVAAKGPSEAPTPQFIREVGGTTYYCGQGTWGTIEYTADGKQRPHSAVPAASPPWVAFTGFEQILPFGDGVFFSGWNGIVFWNRGSGEHLFFPLAQWARTFVVHGEVFVSSLTEGIKRVDLAARTLQSLKDRGLDGVAVERETALSDGRILAATSGRQLLLFDGQRLEAWPNGLGARPRGRVTDLITLPDGGIAMAVEGQGVFILSEQGEIRHALVNPEYRQVTGLAAREAGVLWVATGLSVEKILYNIPVEVVDQRLGVPIRWPQVVRWRDRVLIATNGNLYESNPASVHSTEGFRWVAGQPENGVWGLAAQGDQLLVANAFGIFSRDPDGSFSLVLPGINVDRLVMVSPDLCYVIGAKEIAALRRTGARWAECAPRVPGVGYPTMVQAAKTSAWIELGPNRAVRVGLREGRIEVRVFDHFPWSESLWIHVSVVGDTVMLCGTPKGRIYFDEATGTLVDNPPLQRLIAAAPYWISRVRQDATGTYWASYDFGVFKAFAEGDGYRFDCATLDIIKDRVPVIWPLEGDDMWLSSGDSLYHVNSDPALGYAPPTVRPRLVSAIDGRSGRDLSGALTAGPVAPLPYTQNSLTFRFFAGGYTALRAPSYEFSLNGRPILGGDSVLTLPDLREGAHHLEVRLADARGPLGEPLTLDFAIAPPWYRTWYVRVAVLFLGVLFVTSTFLWSVRRTRSRNQALEKLVQERTEELRTTMARLEEETRNAATLAERDRLAGEIHDSLQQGLSGLMLQLDATLKLPSLADDVRSRLSVARNMVSYTRHEVQNAVWNLASPLLENSDLGEALQKLVALIGSESPRVELAVGGAPRPLSPSVRHHLLRIAQEAITNAVRHGAASRVAVVLDFAAGAVTLEVRDDGCGFQPKEVLTRDFGHFGLRGLRGRADKIGGELAIESEPGRGTTIQIRVPLREVLPPDP